jgi:hypothetical protein
MTKRRMKIFMIDEDETIKLEANDTPFDPDFIDKVLLHVREMRMEIGWAECEQYANGNVILQAFIVGDYWVQTSNAPGQLHIKGTIPSSLRKS